MWAVSCFQISCCAYKMFDALRSSDYDLPQLRGRLYFVGVEVTDEEGNPTGNSEGTLVTPQ